MITGPVKRFIVFAHDQYYPSGGWADSRDSFDTLEEALDYILKIDKDFDYTEVIDTQTGEVVG